MAIDIELQPKPPSRNVESAAQELFPRIVNSDIVGEQKLAEAMAAFGAMSRGHAKEALTDLGEVMAKLLREGKTIDIPMIGSFKISIGVKGIVTPSAVESVDKVKVMGVNFQPSKELMEGISKPDFHVVARNAAPIIPSAADLVAPLYEYFESHDSITRMEFAALFKLKRTTALDRLNKLQEMRMVKSVGSNKETKYIKAQ